MIDDGGMVAATLATASAAVPRTSPVDFFEDNNHHLSQPTIVFPTRSILFFWRYQTNQDVQQLLTPRSTIDEKTSPPPHIASGVRIHPQPPSSSSTSPAHAVHQPPMEALQKLPIIRMMTRSSAPPVNNSTPQDSPPPTTTPQQPPAHPPLGTPHPPPPPPPHQHPTPPPSNRPPRPPANPPSPPPNAPPSPPRAPCANSPSTSSAPPASSRRQPSRAKPSGGASCAPNRPSTPRTPTRTSSSAPCRTRCRLSTSQP